MAISLTAVLRSIVSRQRHASSAGRETGSVTSITLYMMRSLNMMRTCRVRTCESPTAVVKMAMAKPKFDHINTDTLTED